MTINPFRVVPAIGSRPLRGAELGNQSRTVPGNQWELVGTRQPIADDGRQRGAPARGRWQARKRAAAYLPRGLRAAIGDRRFSSPTLIGQIMRKLGTFSTELGSGNWDHTQKQGINAAFRDPASLAAPAAAALAGAPGGQAKAGSTRLAQRLGLVKLPASAPPALASAGRVLLACCGQNRTTPATSGHEALAKSEQSVSITGFLKVAISGDLPSLTQLVGLGPCHKQRHLAPVDRQAMCPSRSRKMPRQAQLIAAERVRPVSSCHRMSHPADHRWPALFWGDTSRHFATTRQRTVGYGSRRSVATWMDGA
jgi:hypothetical protein